MAPSIKKSLSTVFAILVALLLFFILLVLFWLGPTAKALIEGIGPKALGTPVTIESLSINPRNGTLDLHGFQIGLHEGFSRTNTWELADLHISIDMRSLFSDTIIIHQIEIDSPHFTYEKSEATDNISEFIQNLQTFAKIDPDHPKEKKKKTTPAPDKKKKRVVVEWLKIHDMRVELAHTSQSELDLQLGVEELSLCLTNGLIQLDHLILSDPGRLSTPNATEIESITIQLDSDSIYSETLVIEDVQISKPYAYFEHNAQTDTLSEFMKIVDTFTSSAPPAPRAKKTAPSRELPPKTAPPVRLHSLSIHDIQLHIINMADPGLNIRFKLEKLAINATEGTVDLKHFTLTNPSRLTTPNLFELDTIAIKIDPASLFSEPVLIEEVRIDKPHAFLEKNATTDTVAEFIKISNRFAAQTSGARPSSPPKTKPLKTDPVAKTAPPIELNHFEINDIQLKLLDSTPTTAPPTLRTLAAIKRITLEFMEGSLRVESITLPNPPSFETTNLFHLAQIQISVDPASIFSDQKIIHKVFVDTPTLQIEQVENTGNLTELLQTIADFTPPKTSPSSPEPPSEPAPEPIPMAEQPLLLDLLEVTNFTVHIIAPTSTHPQDSEKADPIEPTHEEEVSEKTSIDLLAFDHLSLEAQKGLLEVANLKIGNLEGFASENLIKIKRYRMDFQPSSLQTSTFIIEDILVDQPQIAYERQLTTDNIQSIQDFIESTMQRKDEYTGKQELQKPAKQETAQKKVIIEHLELRKGSISAKLSIIPTIPGIPLRLELTDLGKEEGGTSFTEASRKITGALYDSIVEAVSQASGMAGDVLKGAGSFTANAFGGLTGGLTDSIGGLIGKEDSLDEATPNPKKDEPKKKKKFRLFPRRR